MIQLCSQGTKELRARLTLLLKHLPAKLYTLLPNPQHKSITAYPLFDLTL
jgi:hypothetical protein